MGSSGYSQSPAQMSGGGGHYGSGGGGHSVGYSGSSSSLQSSPAGQGQLLLLVLLVLLGDYIIVQGRGTRSGLGCVKLFHCIWYMVYGVWWFVSVLTWLTCSL